MKRRWLIGRLFQGARISVICIAHGLKGGRHCACADSMRPARLWVSFITQTIRDLASLFFHELVPDPYESRSTGAECTVVFIPGFSMTARGASPLMANICAAGFEIATCEERMWFKNVFKITRWTYAQVAQIRASGRRPILLGYSMGGDIAQRVARRMEVDVISLSRPIASQYTFFAALDLILRGGSPFEKTIRHSYGISLSESFSFHIPRPDCEGHTTIKGVYSHFAVNNPMVIQAVLCMIKELAGESDKATHMPHICFDISGLPQHWPQMTTTESLACYGDARGGNRVNRKGGVQESANQQIQTNELSQPTIVT